MTNIASLNDLIGDDVYERIFIKALTILDPDPLSYLLAVLCRLISYNHSFLSLKGQHQSCSH